MLKAKNEVRAATTVYPQALPSCPPCKQQKAASATEDTLQNPHTTTNIRAPMSEAAAASIGPALL